MLCPTCFRPLGECALYGHMEAVLHLFAMLYAVLFFWVEWKKHRVEVRLGGAAPYSVQAFRLQFAVAFWAWVSAFLVENMKRISALHTEIEFFHGHNFAFVHMMPAGVPAPEHPVQQVLDLPVGDNLNENEPHDAQVTMSLRF
jgi:hypothetical protein